MKKNWKIFLIIGIILLILCTSAIISSLAEKVPPNDISVTGNLHFNSDSIICLYIIGINIRCHGEITYRTGERCRFTGRQWLHIYCSRTRYQCFPYSVVHVIETIKNAAYFPLGRNTDNSVELTAFYCQFS